MNAGPRPKEPFGIWLLDQRERDDWIGDLARGASADPLYPKLGMPADVMERVRLAMGDADAAQAVDAAANEWLDGYGWALEGLINPEPEATEEGQRVA